MVCIFRRRMDGGISHLRPRKSKLDILFELLIQFSLIMNVRANENFR